MPIININWYTVNITFCWKGNFVTLNSANISDQGSCQERNPTALAINQFLALLLVGRETYLYNITTLAMQDGD